MAIIEAETDEQTGVVDNEGLLEVMTTDSAEAYKDLKISESLMPEQKSHT